MRLSDLDAFGAALGHSGPQPARAYDGLCLLCDRVIGVKLFTIMDHDPRRDLVRRLYSNMPDAYPVSGTKPADKSSPWYAQVIGRQEIFSANSYHGITGVFADHALIRTLGCAAVINIPIVVAGEVLGTLNCLHAEGFYTPDKVAAAANLKLPGAACLLLGQLMSGRP